MIDNMPSEDILEVLYEKIKNLKKSARTLHITTISRKGPKGMVHMSFFVGLLINTWHASVRRETDEI